jgi:hypothetical protein
MNDKKPWWQSKTIWAAVLTALLGAYGQIDASLNDQLPNIPDWVFVVLAAFGLYGRVVATKQVG